MKLAVDNTAGKPLVTPAGNIPDGPLEAPDGSLVVLAPRRVGCGSGDELIRASAALSRPLNFCRAAAQLKSLSVH